MKSASDIWESALGELQVQVSKPNFDTWLKDTRGVSCRDGLFTVGVPNAFVGEWLNSRLRPLIARTISSILGKNTDIEFMPVAVETLRPAPIPAPVQNDGGVSLRERPTVSIAHPRLNPRYTFETFISGDSNRLPYSSALEVAESPLIQYNPLYIYGATGMGKTHLLHAIAHITSKRMNTLYMTAEHFTNEFVAAVKGRHVEDFRARFHDVEVFIIDDIQFIGGREQTQECLLHIFIDLHNSNCRIVIAGDRPPQGLPSLDERLQSRFSWGLVTRISPPDRDTRLAILQTQVSNKGLKVPQAVLELVADRLPGNVREMEGVLNQIVARAKLAGSGPDVKIASQVVTELVAPPHGPGQSTAPSPKTIIEAVARAFSVTPQALISTRRDKMTTLARQIAMYLMHEVAGYRVADIGRSLGNRDHSTIIHGFRKIAETLKSDKVLKDRLEPILQEITPRNDNPPAVDKPANIPR
ncbi:MAG: chromosomal replication initiator protein DnaA [Chloroflexota bacterium]